MIVLLDHFVWNGAGTSSFVTPWMSFPEMYKNAELVVDTKLTDGNTHLQIELQSSTDTTAPLAITSGVTAGATPGPESTAVASGLQRNVRLKLSTTGTAQTNTMLSVWLIPKND